MDWQADNRVYGRTVSPWNADLTPGGGAAAVGLQAIGPYLEDFTPIRFAALPAREIGGYARPPGYDV